MDPSRDEDRALHARLLAGDPVAPSECFARYGPIVTRNLRARLDAPDPDLYSDAATDSIVSYVKAPGRYNPDGATLAGYLTMDAGGDLRNLLQKEARRARRTDYLDEHVELDDPAGNSMEEDDAIELPPGVTAEQALAELAREMPDATDRRLLELMFIDEQGDTPAAARVMGIEHLSPAEQRDIVYRAKDRIKRRLRRLGERLKERLSDHDQPG